MRESYDQYLTKQNSWYNIFGSYPPIPMFFPIILICKINEIYAGNLQSPHSIN